MSTFPYDERCKSLAVESDSDHAGFTRTRKSMSGGDVRWGAHVLKWWSKTQPTIALSSGEAELSAIVKATSEGLGLVATMKEWGIEVDLVVKSDAIAAIGMVKRLGLGRIRHLAVADLWIQQKSREGLVHYRKLEGTRNTSDILTKPVEAEVLERHLRSLGMEFRCSRNAFTPAYSGRWDPELSSITHTSSHAGPLQ